MVLPLLVGEGGAKQRVRVAHSQWMTCFHAYNFGIRLCVLLTKSLGTLYDFLMRLRIESTGSLRRPPDPVANQTVVPNQDTPQRLRRFPPLIGGFQRGTRVSSPTET